MTNFTVLPPEINSLRMFGGAGSAPMLSAAAAWDGLAGELESAAESFASVTAGLAEQAWQGPAAAAMTAAAAPYAGFLSAASAQAAAAAGQAQAVVAAFETAHAAMIHPVAVAANRNVFVQLVMSNLLGQNAPAIAATESVYEQMWAQDVAAMFGYHSGASSAAASLIPLPASLQQFLAGLPSVGLGNKGNANLGSGNTGGQNLGSGNSGFGNIGGGNRGNDNNGISNHGNK